MTDDGTCNAINRHGEQCKQTPGDDGFCYYHGPEDAPDEDDAADDEEEEESADEEEEVASDKEESESEDEEELGAEEFDLDEARGNYVRVRNPDDEHKKAALVGFHPNETKVMRAGIRVKRALERGELEYLGEDD